MKTARGIYLNLNDSDYYLDIEGLRVFFSSKFNKERFTKNIMNYVEEENQKIINKYHMNINLKLFLMISYYKKIEKRGFRIKDLSNNIEINPDSKIINTIL
jgi:YHS domain-containing protein